VGQFSPAIWVKSKSGLINTKLKVLKRRCYGVGNIGRFFQRLTLDVDGYRRFSPWRASPISRVLHGNS
jgi:hypothetical protein